MTQVELSELSRSRDPEFIAPIETQPMAERPEHLPDEYAWIEGEQDYVVCAFYTEDYLPYILNLERSLRAHRVNHYFKLYDKRKNWEATTRIKPHFLLHCLSRFPQLSVLYIDADATLKRYPALLDQITTDIAAHLQPVRKAGRSKTRIRLASGTLFIRNTPGGRAFLEAYRDSETEFGAFAKDGDMLQLAVGKCPGTTLTFLPATYASRSGRSDDETVFEHYHASKDRFKWEKAFRKSWQLAFIAAAIGALVVSAYMLTF